ncbi:unnamed protein product [Owenia fusiformis]|uniref:G-protein coupled receptors family 3 profile domain-containing protein n=1 Tax=Owenia fusiformis TaxID=6347 RepID=A0A8S4NKZ3_OWEFU|nr:unnamed protein product [Owenia fusiformis]
MTLARGLVVLLSVLTLHSVACRFIIPDLPNKQFVIQGDLILGGLFPISTYHPFEPCGGEIASEAMMQFVEAMAITVKLVNLRSDILPNVTLGMAVLDTCGKDTTALVQVLHFLPQNETDECASSTNTSTTDADGFFEVVGVVGAYKSTSSLEVANLLGPFEIPQMSYGSTSDLLSDRTRYPYFMRVVPPDQSQTNAMIDFIHHFNWTYIHAIHSIGVYGEGAVANLRLLAKSRGVCLATDIQVKEEYTDGEWENVVNQLLVDSRAKVVVVYAGPDHVLGLFSAAKRMKITRRFIWIGSDAWAEGIRTNRLNGLKDIMLGAFTFNVFAKTIPLFGTYFKGLNPNNNAENPWFSNYWESYFNCTFSNSTEKQQCNTTWEISEDNGYMESRSLAAVVDSVYVFANALDKIIKNTCPGLDPLATRNCINGPTLYQYLRNSSYDGNLGEIEFDRNGDVIGTYDIEQIYIDNNTGGFEQDVVARWFAKTSNLSFLVNITDIPWYLDTPASTAIPKSICSDPCDFGFYYVRQDLACCWDCKKCRENEIVTLNQTDCETCPIYYWPNGNFTKCDPIEPDYMRWYDPEAIMLVAFASLGIAATLTVLGFFIKHREHKLIKASSRELCYIMLVGMLIGYGTVFGFITPPVDINCYLDHFGFSLGFAWVYAPLLTRTNRIYRIFDAGKKSTKRPSIIGSRSQVVIATVLITIQVVISFITAVITPPEIGLSMPLITEKYVELSCDMPLSSLLTSLSYNILLVLLCAFYAFKTRKLPDNFNESRFISMCVYTTLVIWCALIPIYFTTTIGKGFLKIIILSLALLLNCTVALVMFFVPKIYALLCISEEAIQYAETQQQPGGAVRPLNETNMKASSSVEPFKERSSILASLRPPQPRSP